MKYLYPLIQNQFPKSWISGYLLKAVLIELVVVSIRKNLSRASKTNYDGYMVFLAAIYVYKIY